MLRMRSSLPARGIRPEFGVTLDRDPVMRGRRLGEWITDGPGGMTWKDDTDPTTLFAAWATPIFAVIHANN